MNGPHVLQLLLVPLLAVGFSFASPIAAETVAAPAAAYIDDVPFVGFGEAAKYEYPGKDYLNPAVPAAREMVSRYWGQPCLPDGCGDNPTVGFMDDERIDGGSPEDLKALVDARVPAVVFLATTPYAHRAYTIFSMLSIAMLGEEHVVQQTHATSGCQYVMAPLESVYYAVENGCDIGVNDSVIDLPRVLVGYDDERQIFVVHDPSLGPHLEIPYEDFFAMWRISGNQYTLIRPADWEARLDSVERTRARTRTVDDDAAVALFYGTALAATGRYDEAEAMFNEALELPGISDGREHLLRLELAAVMAEAGNFNAAISQVEKANAAFDGHAAAWRLLAALEQKKKRANKLALWRFVELCKDKRQKEAAYVLAQDFYLMGCRAKYSEGEEVVSRTEYLGWGSGFAVRKPKPTQPTAEEMEDY